MYTALSIRRNGSGHCALEFERGLKWASYIGLTQSGPRVFKIKIDEFDKTFKVLASYTPKAAALKFLDVAKRAYEHNDEVLVILLEIIMGKQASEMSVAELVVAYNEVAQAIGEKIRKNFKSKAEGLSALAALDEKAKTAAPDQAKVAVAKEEKAAKRKAAAPPKEPKEKKERKPGIGDFCKGLITKGKTNEEILAAVAAQFPGAKTSKSCVAYYRFKMKAAKV